MKGWHLIPPFDLCGSGVLLAVLSVSTSLRPLPTSDKTKARLHTCSPTERTETFLNSDMHQRCHSPVQFVPTYHPYHGPATYGPLNRYGKRPPRPLREGSHQESRLHGTREAPGKSSRALSASQAPSCLRDGTRFPLGGDMWRAVCRGASKQLEKYAQKGAVVQICSCARRSAKCARHCAWRPRRESGALYRCQKLHCFSSSSRPVVEASLHPLSFASPFAGFPSLPAFAASVCSWVSPRPRPALHMLFSSLYGQAAGTLSSASPLASLQAPLVWSPSAPSPSAELDERSVTSSPTGIPMSSSPLVSACPEQEAAFWSTGGRTSVRYPMLRSALATVAGTEGEKAGKGPVNKPEKLPPGEAGESGGAGKRAPGLYACDGRPREGSFTNMQNLKLHTYTWWPCSCNPALVAAKTKEAERASHGEETGSDSVGNVALEKERGLRKLQQIRLNVRRFFQKAPLGRSECSAGSSSVRHQTEIGQSDQGSPGRRSPGLPYGSSGGSTASSGGEGEEHRRRRHTTRAEELEQMGEDKTEREHLHTVESGDYGGRPVVGNERATTQNGAKKTLSLGSHGELERDCETGDIVCSVCKEKVRGVVVLVHGYGEHCRSHFLAKPLVNVCSSLQVREAGRCREHERVSRPFSRASRANSPACSALPSPLPPLASSSSSSTSLLGGKGSAVSTTGGGSPSSLPRSVGGELLSLSSPPLRASSCEAVVSALSSSPSLASSSSACGSSRKDADGSSSSRLKELGRGSETEEPTEKRSVQNLPRSSSFLSTCAPSPSSLESCSPRSVLLSLSSSPFALSSAPSDVPPVASRVPFPFSSSSPTSASSVLSCPGSYPAAASPSSSSDPASATDVDIPSPVTPSVGSLDLLQYSGSWVEKLNQLGFLVLGFDMQGHGQSAGWKGLRCVVSELDDFAKDVLLFVLLSQNRFLGESSLSSSGIGDERRATEGITNRSSDGPENAPPAGLQSAEQAHSVGEKQEPLGSESRPCFPLLSRQRSSDLAKEENGTRVSHKPLSEGDFPFFLMGVSMGGWASARAAELAGDSGLLMKMRRFIRSKQAEADEKVETGVRELEGCHYTAEETKRVAASAANPWGRTEVRDGNHADTTQEQEHTQSNSSTERKEFRVVPGQTTELEHGRGRKKEEDLPQHGRRAKLVTDQERSRAGGQGAQATSEAENHQRQKRGNEGQEVAWEAVQQQQGGESHMRREKMPGLSTDGHVESTESLAQHGVKENESPPSRGAVVAAEELAHPAPSSADETQELPRRAPSSFSPFSYLRSSFFASPSTSASVPAAPSSTLDGNDTTRDGHSFSHPAVSPASSFPSSWFSQASSPSSSSPLASWFSFFPTSADSVEEDAEDDSRRDRDGRPLGLDGLILLSPMFDMERRKAKLNWELVKYGVLPLASLFPGLPLSWPGTLKRKKENHRESSLYDLLRLSYDADPLTYKDAPPGGLVAALMRDAHAALDPGEVAKISPENVKRILIVHSATDTTCHISGAVRFYERLGAEVKEDSRVQDGAARWEKKEPRTPPGQVSKSSENKCGEQGELWTSRDGEVQTHPATRGNSREEKTEGGGQREGKARHGVWNNVGEHCDSKEESPDPGLKEGREKTEELQERHVADSRGIEKLEKTMVLLNTSAGDSQRGGEGEEEKAYYEFLEKLLRARKRHSEASGAADDAYPNVETSNQGQMKTTSYNATEREKLSGRSISRSRDNIHDGRERDEEGQTCGLRSTRVDSEECAKQRLDRQAQDGEEKTRVGEGYVELLEDVDVRHNLANEPGGGQVFAVVKRWMLRGGRGESERGGEAIYRENDGKRRIE